MRPRDPFAEAGAQKKGALKRKGVVRPAEPHTPSTMSVCRDHDPGGDLKGDLWEQARNEPDNDPSCGIRPR